MYLKYELEGNGAGHFTINEHNNAVSTGVVKFNNGCQEMII
jgi:hypothetical protein